MKIEFKKQLIYWANIILLTVNVTFFFSCFRQAKMKSRQEARPNFQMSSSKTNWDLQTDNSNC